MKKSLNWGNYPKVNSKIKNFNNNSLIKNFKEINIPYGNGRSYGDCCIGDVLIDMKNLNRIISFNSISGELITESGVLIRDIIEKYYSIGWFPQVVPGTKLITIGGAIASDVHGKNHHSYGCFSKSINWIDLLLPDGKIYRCSSTNNSDLFKATCGGMGLTGYILKASINLKKIDSAFISQETLKADNLETVFELFEKYKDIPYSVAWIDSLSNGKQLGRSILFVGDFLKDENFDIKPRKNITIPFYFPNPTLNEYTIKIFNSLYYSKNGNDQTKTVDYETFFFPLDSLQYWNRIYGNKGFLQYQFIIPKENSLLAITSILEKINKSKFSPFLSVLKLYGKENSNYLSFPLEGYSLALDFKLTSGIFEFLNQLDLIVLKYNGRVYLAKDARMKKETFNVSYSEIEKFKEIRKKYDLEKYLNSYQSIRLDI